MVTVFDISAGELVKVSATQSREADLVPMVMPGCNHSMDETPKQQTEQIAHYDLQLALQMVEYSR